MVCPPLGAVECRRHVEYPAFAPDPGFRSQLFRSGSWVSGLFNILSIICPNCMCTLISHALWFLCISVAPGMFVQM